MHTVAVNSARSTYRRMKNQAIAVDAMHLERPDPQTTSVKELVKTINTKTSYRAREPKPAPKKG